MNNKGVSMVQLIITIIIVIILATLAITSSNNITPEANIARSFASIKGVKEACENAENLIEIDPDTYKETNIFGKKLGDDAESYYTKIGLSSVSELSDRTYLISKDRQNAKNLELDNLLNEYIVDLGNEKYYLVGGVVRGNDKFAYEYADILKMYNMLTDENN